MENSKTKEIIKIIATAIISVLGTLLGVSI